MKDLEERKHEAELRANTAEDKVSTRWIQYKATGSI